MRDYYQPGPPVTTDARTWIAARMERERRALLVETQGTWLDKAALRFGGVVRAAWAHEDARDWGIAVGLTLVSVLLWTC